MSTTIVGTVTCDIDRCGATYRKSYHNRGGMNRSWIEYLARKDGWAARGDVARCPTHRWLRQRQRTWTDEQRAQAIRLRDRGLSYRAIAEEMGLPLPKVWRMVNK